MNRRGLACHPLSAGGLLLLLLLAGCANTVFHFFSFNATENPGIEVLDYQYGDSRQPSARPTEASKRNGEVRQAVRMGGEILRPDKLYVKWRVLSNGAVFEQTVDLAKLLPRDIRRHEIHFTIDGPRLSVYLVSPKGRSPEDPPVALRDFPNQKVTTLWSGYGRSLAQVTIKGEI